jgi:hypothetical protein
MPAVIQTSLLCGCGSSRFSDGGICPVCSRRARLSLEDFGGLREQALKRDGYQCQVCGELDPARLLVHHRAPGVQKLDRLLTLCRGCHARIHHTWRPGWAFLSFALLRRLWRELHRDLPEQRLLAALALEQRTQALLFDSEGDGDSAASPAVLPPAS